jgi:hypothetical protein
VVSILALQLGGPGHPDAGLSWFFSAPPAKFCCTTFKQAMTAYSRILYDSTQHIFIRRYKTVEVAEIKVKVELFLCLTKHHVMKAYWGSGGIDPRIPDLGTIWR